MPPMFTPVPSNATLASDESLLQLQETHKKVSGIYFRVRPRESPPHSAARETH